MHIIRVTMLVLAALALLVMLYCPFVLSGRISDREEHNDNLRKTEQG